MRSTWLALAGVLAVMLATGFGVIRYEKAYVPSPEIEDMGELPIDHELVTPNTGRIGSDDPVETAVAVSHIIYPVTEEENSPGAVVLINRNNFAEAIVAASRVQHFPVNAPLLYVDENGIPELTRQELNRLKPEGVPMDGNVQVYLVGTIGDAVREEVEGMGYKVRVLTAGNPVELAVVADDWSSTQHGDHPNDVVIANLDNLAPSVPSAFWNAHMGDAVAFVTNDGIPQETINMLERRVAGPWIYVFGSESVVSAEIVRELGQYGHVTRIPGDTPPETSAHFAAFHDEGMDWGLWFWEGARSFGWGIGEAGHNAIFVNLNGPEGWQNALPATTLSHMGKHAPVLILDDAEGIPDAVTAYLNITKPYEAAPQQQLLNHGWIIGGEETISWTTQTQIDLMLEARPIAPAESEGSE